MTVSDLRPSSFFHSFNFIDARRTTRRTERERERERDIKPGQVTD